MKRRIFLSVSTIVVCISLMIGVSYAIFSDKVEFEDNFISTSKVDISATIDEQTDSIYLPNLNQGESHEFELKIENKSTTNIAYRLIFVAKGDVELLDVLTFSLNKEEVTFDSNRGVTDWVNGITPSDETISKTLTIKMDKSIESKYQGKSLYFNFTIEAIQDKFVVVDNQEELSSVVNNEYVKLSKDFLGNDITISKDIYLDLNNLELNSITITGDEIKLIELVNGKTNTLDIDAPNSTVYCNIEVINQIEANTGSNSFYYNNEQTSQDTLNINVVGGRVVLNTTAKLNVSVVSPKENSKPVVISTTTSTTIEKLIVEEDSSTNVKLDIKGELIELEVKNEELELEYEDELPTHPDLLYVSNIPNEETSILIDGKLYQTVTVSLEEAIVSNKSLIYFEEGTYKLNSTLEIKRDLVLIGLGEVCLVKNSSDAYLENSLILIDDCEVTFENITFKDHKSSDEKSSAISTTNYTNKVNVLNCNFELFSKNCITISNGKGLIDNTTFTYTTKTSTPNAIQVDRNSIVDITNCTINGFESSVGLSATGVIVLRGGKANLENNSFINCTEAITITNVYNEGYLSCEFTESNNTYENCNVNVVIKDVAYIITKDEFTNYYYSKVDETTNYLYYYDVEEVCSSITDALAIQESKYESNPNIVTPKFLVLEGTYNEATKKDNGNPLYNVYIKCPVSIIGVGEVIVTTDNKNEVGTAQQIILITSDNVTLDNLNIYTTTATSNSTDKAIEVRSGSNIVIKNCNMYYGKLNTELEGEESTAGIFIQGNNVGNYTLINNTTNNMDISLVIANGAGNASKEVSYVTNNNFNSGINFIGEIDNKWSFNDVEVLPVIENNQIGLSTVEINETEVSYNLYSISSDITKVLSNEYFLDVLRKNNLEEKEVTNYILELENETNYISLV